MWAGPWGVGRWRWPCCSRGLSEQKLSGSHKALVEMQDIVAELLRTVPREHPATQVRAGAGPTPTGGGTSWRHPPSVSLRMFGGSLKSSAS